MNKNQIREIVITALKEYLETQDIITEENDDSALIGDKSLLDSMGLVNVIIDIESKFLDKDIEISITSEKAMSRKNSPFRTVSSLVAFIQEQIGKDHE